jgi:kynurenine 3-monooxygenase
MIDLSGTGWSRIFLRAKNLGCYLSEATLHIGETERGAWEEKKYDIVFGADGV